MLPWWWLCSWRQTLRQPTTHAVFYHLLLARLGVGADFNVNGTTALTFIFLLVEQHPEFHT